ncbi:restriction endonuclease subunit R, partial [Nodularia sp. UHCC 0506]|nr:restriction endonuclease subunit R [Nodularia sp. UHCC 0506]
MGKQLFTTRLELIAELDKKVGTDSLSEVGGNLKASLAANEEPKPDAELRRQVANLLHTEVAAMNSENFVVRPKRRLVEKYTSPEAWRSLSDQDFTALSQEVAGLPSQLASEAEEIKRFDILVLKLQLAVMRLR